jgi:hypothetical protein
MRSLNESFLQVPLEGRPFGSGSEPQMSCGECPVPFLLRELSARLSPP